MELVYLGFVLCWQKKILKMVSKKPKLQNITKSYYLKNDIFHKYKITYVIQ